MKMAASCPHLHLIAVAVASMMTRDMLIDAPIKYGCHLFPVFSNCLVHPMST